MENKGIASLGEDLVILYDIPAATDKDPSGWVFWAFILFFSMIVADAGYGLVYLILILFLKKKFPPVKSSGKRFVKLSLFIATSCIVWGLCTSAVFGVSFNPEGPIGRLSPLFWLAEKKTEYHLAHRDAVYQSWIKQYPKLASAQTGRDVLEEAVKVEPGGRVYELLDEFSDNILLEISVLIGLVHVSLSLLRYGLRHVANFGWVIFAIGGYLYFPIFLGATSLLHFLGVITPDAAEIIGIELIFIGLLFAVVAALVQKRLKGVGEIMQGIQIFSDIISYLRLYALALASTIMARTFNEMGSELYFVVGIFVIIFGHAVNLLLGTMSGVIHGLRLNFIEWYHYCFEGDGRLLQPLRKLKKYKTLQG
jgi:V/A-type H+/Na+-transporting ATPase subunit I